MSRTKLLSLSAAILLSAASSHAAVIYGVTSSNSLVRFNSSTPGVVNSIGAITGLAAGDTILGIDMRPATGELFALGRDRVYTVDTATGAATGIGGGAFNLMGGVYGFDFNPTVDRMRVTGADGRIRLTTER